MFSKARLPLVKVVAIYYAIVNGVSYAALENQACINISPNTWPEYVKVKGGGGGGGMAAGEKN